MTLSTTLPLDNMIGLGVPAAKGVHVCIESSDGGSHALGPL